MSLKIVGFLGKKGHGKDTCADHLVKNGYKKYAFATILKDFLSLVFGLTHDQLYGNLREVVDNKWGVSPRELLQYFGTTVFRQDISRILPNIGDNFWVECLRNKILSIVEENKKNNIDTLITISDVRFQNEVDMIHSIGGIVVKIHRDNVNTNDQHISETAIDTFQNYDFIINNNSTIDFMTQAIDNIIEN